jgi:Ulp1 family protease
MNEFCEQVIQYLNDEYKNQQIGIDFLNTDNCTIINMNNYGSKLQHDGCSCGVFVCMWMDFLSHGFDYSLVDNNNMEHFRLYIAFSLKEGFLIFLL